MDGKGRWVDNVFIERFWRTVKYEHFFLRNFNDVAEVKVSIKDFIEVYSHKRLHQNLNYQTPAEVYQKKNEKEVKNISKKESLQKAKKKIQLWLLHANLRGGVFLWNIGNKNSEFFLDKNCRKITKNRKGFTH